MKTSVKGTGSVSEETLFAMTRLTAMGLVLECRYRYAECGAVTTVAKTYQICSS